MDISVTTVSLCAGAKHVTFVGTANGQGSTVTIPVADLSLDLSDSDAIRAAFIARVRSAVKEAGAVTLTQMKTALEAHSFKI